MKIPCAVCEKELATLGLVKFATALCAGCVQPVSCGDCAALMEHEFRACPRCNGARRKTSKHPANTTRRADFSSALGSIGRQR